MAWYWAGRLAKAVVDKGDERKNLNQVYLVSAGGVAEMTSDIFALVGVAEITANRLGPTGDAIDFDLEEAGRVPRPVEVEVDSVDPIWLGA